MRNNIKNEELKKRILRVLNKSDLEDITEEDLLKIENISFNKRLVNGEETYIKISDIHFFPLLKSITLKGYLLTMEDIEIIAKQSNIENVSFIGCEFKDIDFDNISRIPQNLRFSYCKSLPKKFPNVKIVNIDYSDIDFDSINFNHATSLFIKYSNIKNIHNIEEYENILEVNLDGSILFDSAGNEIQNIIVGKKTLYTHKEEKKYETTSNDMLKLNKEIDGLVDLER